MSSGPHPVTVPDRFACILEGLLAGVAMSALAGLLAVFGGAVWTRISRVRVKVLALLARIDAGTLRQFPERKRENATRRELDEAARQRLAERGKTWGRMPRRTGWLLVALHWSARGRAEQLAHLLADAEMKRYLAASPRLARMLRPLCRMLGIGLALLGEPPAERKPRTRRKAPEGAEAPTGEKPRRVRRRKDGAEPAEPSRAEIKRILATRRWPSIEMQADPKRYPWYPKEDAPEAAEAGTGKKSR